MVTFTSKKFLSWAVLCVNHSKEDPYEASADKDERTLQILLEFSLTIHRTKDLHLRLITDFSK